MKFKCIRQRELGYMSRVMRKPVYAKCQQHLRSLISAFVVRFLDGIIHQVSISEISSLYLASVAEQAGLSLPWSQTLKTGFLATRLILCLELANCENPRK